MEQPYLYQGSESNMIYMIYFILTYPFSIMFIQLFVLFPHSSVMLKAQY